MKISVAVMAHPSRAEEAERLYRKLFRQNFYEVGLVFDDGNGEWETGKRSLLCHTDSDWHIVIQDDAIISDNFYDNALQAIVNVPEPTLLSFYTGTVRPYRSKVSRAVNKARAEQASYLSFNTLCWGVAFAIPTKDIETILDFVSSSRLLYDARIGSYYQKTWQNVYYTNPSIVDHNWELPSLTGHNVVLKRVAHRYEPGIVEWNNKVVEIV